MNGYLIKGLLAGLAIAAPVGPTTALVLYRTLKNSVREGVLSGAGAATADALFALLAGIGAGFVSGYVEPHYLLIRFVGGMFLVYWGQRIFLSRFAESHPLLKDKGFGGPIISTFILTLTNPMTLLAFGAILVALRSSGLQHHPGLLGEWMLGVCAGSLLWWIILSLGVHVYRKIFEGKILTRLNQAMGIIVVFAGGAVLLDFIKMFLHK